MPVDLDISLLYTISPDSQYVLCASPCNSGMAILPASSLRYFLFVCLFVAFCLFVSEGFFCFGFGLVWLVCFVFPQAQQQFPLVSASL